MEIKDFILKEERETEAKETNQKQIVRKKPSVEYTVLAENEMDFVIERKSARTSAIMAVIPSKEQFYITKTTKKGDTEEVEEVSFNADGVSWFLSGLEEPMELDDKLWITALEKGKSFANELCDFIRTKKHLIKTGIVGLGQPCDESLTYIYEESPRLGQYLINQKRVVPKRASIIPKRARYTAFQPFACGMFDTAGNNRNNMVYLLLFEAIFGLDATRNYVNAFIERDINASCQDYRFQSLMETFYQITCGADILSKTPRYGRCGYTRYGVNEKLLGNKNLPHIDPKAFTDYCLTYQREGFISLGDMFGTLEDDWKLQAMLCDTIVEKYPKDLASHHQRLVFKTSFLSDEYDKKKFEEYYNANKHLEWNNSKYVVTAPQNVDEMIDEAIQQNNCLRSYIDSVIEGVTSIFFLRQKSAPDRSLVTIQVTDGDIVQVKGKFNRRPSNSEMDAVYEWAKERKLNNIA